MKTPNRPSDAELLHRISTGDSNAFSCFYQRHQKTLLHTCNMVIRQPDLAQDALQDAIITIWKRASSYSADTGSVRPWACRIAARACLKTLQKNRKLRPTLMSQQGNANNNSALNIQLHKEELKLLREALNQLPAQDRQLILSYYESNLSQPAIAAQHSIPQTTVSFRVRRALKILKSIMCSHQQTA